MLEYYDAFQVGLTATPDARTIAYFRQNIVSEYSHEMAVADGVNVGYDVFLIETKVTQKGGTLWKGEYIEHRERLTRKKRMELQDEDEAYSSKQLDKDIVNPNQISTVIRTFKEHLPKCFLTALIKTEISKFQKHWFLQRLTATLMILSRLLEKNLAKKIVFVKKLTYKATEDPKIGISAISQ